MDALHLYSHEREYLLEALRRDMRAESERAGTDPEWSGYHAENARHDLRLLETLNPKHTGRPVGDSSHPRTGQAAVADLPLQITSTEAQSA